MRLGSSSGDKPKKESTPERKEMHTKLGLLMITVLIDLIGFSIIIPLVPAYVARGLHESAHAASHDPRIGSYGGALISVYALMQFIFAPIWGRISDKVGRKPILIMSLVGDAIFYTVFALSPGSLIGQFASRVLAGIFSSASLSVAQAYVADVTPPEERATGLGMMGAVFGVAFILGPAIGGALGQFSLGLPLFLSSGLALVNLVYLIKYVPESRPKPVRDAVTQTTPPMSLAARIASMTAALSGPVGFLYLLTFLVTFAFANLEGTFTAYLAQHFHYGGHSPVSVAGYVFAYVGFIIVLVQGGLIRPLVKKYGETYLIIVGVLLMAIGFLTFPYPGALVWLMIGPMIPIAFGNGLNSPSLRALISRKTAADRQGQNLGISASYDSLARAVGPAVGGVLYARFGQAAPYQAAGVIMLVAFCFALSQKKRLEEAQSVSPLTQPLQSGNQTV